MCLDQSGCRAKNVEDDLQRAVATNVMGVTELQGPVCLLDQ